MPSKRYSVEQIVAEAERGGAAAGAGTAIAQVCDGRAQVLFPGAAERGEARLFAGSEQQRAR